MIRILFFIFLIAIALQPKAQESSVSNLDGIDYTSPKEYEIGGITISGVQHLDHNVLTHLSGLKTGDKVTVPGTDITNAVKKLWKQDLFSNVKISATKIIGDVIFLDIFLVERPRLSRFSFTGVKRSEADDLREQIKFVKGKPITDNVLNNAKNTIKAHFVDKGYRNVEVIIEQIEDTLLINNVILNIKINRNSRIKINEIKFEGNTKNDEYKLALKEENVGFVKKTFSKSSFNDKKLRRKMKDTKQKTWYNIFKTSKFIASNYKTDKENILAKYNQKGYRDAKIIFDTVYNHDLKTINIEMKIDEGKKYYFRNITWVGNTKYPKEKLNDFLGIKKGDVFNQSTLDERLFIDPDGVSSLYLDDGYLAFSVTPAEINVENDSIDIELRMVEGKQFRINSIIITGNSKTNEHVIRREIRTLPGELFRRSEIIRSHRELAQLNYFDPEKLDVKPIPNMKDGTVDLEYVVEEKASDQIELSGGWGAGMVVGTLGLSFNNFSVKKIFKGSAWRPLPSGDGQKLSLRAQSSGLYYQAYSMSFTEPWLGGKKPNSLSFSLYHTKQSNGYKRIVEDTINPLYKAIQISGISLGIGTRMKKPDDYFTFYGEVFFQNYSLNKWTGFIIDEGNSNNIGLKLRLGRFSSGPNMIFPVMGSDFSLTWEPTIPWYWLKTSVFKIEEREYWNNVDATDLTDAELIYKQNREHYKWIEYHKWTFKASWFTSLARKLQDETKSEKTLVLNARINFGLLCPYSKEWGYSPFEGYEVGGDGLAGYNLYGREIVSLRGYENRSLTPNMGANFYNKYTLEMRYPLSLNPNATLYALAFLEGGNAWFNFKDVNPFEIKRSAGLGVRIFLPMFGMLGVDWGYGFDEVRINNVLNPNANGSQFHFVIGQQF
ncbi:MAG: BamA/TamA family outer membrane protein [Bacteroidales bacterium]|nr:BamA/TamA family outer membrane protein [Bacteroidales bacterium]